MDNRRLNHPIEVLMVEDSPDDVFLIQKAFKKINFPVNLSVVGDGAEALAFLRQEGRYSTVPCPDLILLDWNLPKKDGYEVLTEIKTDHNLRTIPVIILTTSAAEEDVLKAYNLHANCYITKPVNINKFIEIVGGIEEFWLTIVELPSLRRR